MVLRPDNESVAEYLGNLELRTTLTQKYNIFSEMKTKEKCQIVQIKMNNILPKITPIVTGEKTFSEIISIPALTVAVWLRKTDAAADDGFDKLFENLPELVENQETKSDPENYYQNFLKNSDEKAEEVPQNIEPQAQSDNNDDNDNGTKTRFLFAPSKDFVLDFKGPDPQNPMDFVQIKKQFLRVCNENISSYIYSLINYHFPDIDANNKFIEISTTEIFDEEPEELTNNSFGQF